MWCVIWNCLTHHHHHLAHFRSNEFALFIRKNYCYMFRIQHFARHISLTHDQQFCLWKRTHKTTMKCNQTVRYLSTSNHQKSWLSGIYTNDKVYVQQQFHDGFIHSYMVFVARIVSYALCRASMLSADQSVRYDWLCIYFTVNQKNFINNTELSARFVLGRIDRSHSELKIKEEFNVCVSLILTLSIEF